MGEQYDPQRARGKRPMPMWWDAFLRDTMDFEADETGAYLLLLGAMWTRSSCDIPNDTRKMARICKVSQAKFKSRIGPAVLPLLSVSDDVVFSVRLRKEAVFVQISVTKQRCRKTGENPAKLLKGKDWGLTTDNSTDNPRDQPTQQPNNPTKGITALSSDPDLPPLFGGQDKKRPPPKPKVDQARGKLVEVASPEAVDGYLQYRKTSKAKGTTDRAAGMIVKQLIAIRDRGGDPDEALDMAQLQGWQGLQADWYFNKKGQDNGNGNSNSTGGQAAGARRSSSSGVHDALMAGFGQAATDVESGARRDGFDYSEDFNPGNS